MALDMTTALTIRAKVDGLGQVQGLGKALGNTEKQANGLAGAFGRLKGAATSMAGVLGAAGLGAILKQSVDTFAKFQAETKLLENGLKNLGAQSGELERLQKVASNLGEATLFNEEDFRKGFGLLTSFGNIGTSNYERVAKAAADVAQTSGTDVSSAFMQLAKALNDPAKGLTALSRSGIQFTEDQKTMIKSMVEAGNTAGAQNMILKELEKQYGGNSVAAAQGLAGALDTLGEKFYDLQVALGDNLTTVLQPLIQGLTSLVGFISGLPEPVQTFIVALGGLTIALTALGGILAIGAPIFSALAGLAAGFAALGPIVAGLGTVLAVVFTGPVGIAALVIAAGIAIYAFRDQIGAAFTAIGEYFKQLPAGFQSFFIDPLVEGFKLLMEMINTTFIQPVKDAFTATLEFINVNFVQPIQTAFTTLVESIKTIFSSVGNIITSPFKAAFETVRGIVNQILNSIGSAIGSVVNAVNGVIRGVNRGLAAAKLPQIPLIPAPQIPSFAEGGVVSGPTLAMVGEGGEPEYIVPQSKATKFANNWLSGVRGAAAIPKFAEGGVVVPGSAQVSIQTGPVTQMNGTNYVTTQDLSSAVTAGVNQTLSLLRNDMNTRRTVGLA
jgi:Flp pilus assembly pilin Flp